jgi:hypothetical protein
MFVNKENNQMGVNPSLATYLTADLETFKDIDHKNDTSAEKSFFTATRTNFKCT